MHNKITIPLGTKYGRYTAIARDADMSASGKPRTICRCDCGVVRSVHDYALISGHSTSCGCRRAEVAGARVFVHGLRHTPEYEIWASMRARCRRATNKSYARYGGRGITVDSRWDNFTAFIEDMGPRPSPEYSIDRIDNDGPYSPLNCRWATLREQALNKRRTVILTHEGKSMTIMAWAELLGLTYGTLRQRLNKGWSVSQSLSAPVRLTSRNRHLQPTPHA